MKKFFKSLYLKLFPNILSTEPTPINKINDSFRATAQSVSTFNEAVMAASGLTGKSVKQFRKLRREQMYEEQNLNHDSAHKIAADYKMTLRELVDYYHYFGQLPRPEFKMVIRNYGVGNIIAEFENLMETV